MKLERRNAYFCKSCRKVTITVDVDEGVTPMNHACFYCKEQSVSFMYQIPGCMRYDFKIGLGSILPADEEWYKPDENEMKKLSLSEELHVNKGGLLCRKRTDKPAIMFEV